MGHPRFIVKIGNGALCRVQIHICSPPIVVSGSHQLPPPQLSVPTVTVTPPYQSPHSMRRLSIFC